jgi:translation initiation factor 2B subunit (eIF-2B alpha/beta/delta family)
MSGADDAQIVGRIRDDRQHGASWLAREAARQLARVAEGADDAEERLRRVRALGQALAWARPSMATIANTVARIWMVGEAQAGDAQARLDALRAEALAINTRWASAAAGMAEWARKAVSGAVYTLSRSGTVEQTLTTLARERAGGEPLRVLVGESRPGGEGVALAGALAAAGAQVTLVADSACAAFIDQAALVMVGADSVRSDGAVVNKVGTRTLALVAQAAGKPVFALAERLKVTPDSYPLVIEEMNPAELLPAPIFGVSARNIYFDVTPARLIASVISETGEMNVHDIARLTEEAECAYRSLMGL